MKIKVLATQWGSGSWSASYFLDYVKAKDYAGVEINMPQNQQYVSEFLSKLDEIRVEEDFAFVGQAVLAYQNEGCKEHLQRYKARLEEVIGLKPDFINVQTGADFFSFDQNCAFIACAFELSEKHNIKIIHETHRGKFSFHSLKTLKYLEKFPELELTADLSHWCNVSESLLIGQEEILERIFPKVRHVHARIGFAQAPQVNHFMAPEWKSTRETFLYWWKQILQTNKGREFTFLTEFGPQPYLPSLPYIGVPVADQWELNLKMKDFLLQNL